MNYNGSLQDKIFYSFFLFVLFFFWGGDEWGFGDGCSALFILQFVVFCTQNLHSVLKYVHLLLRLLQLYEFEVWFFVVVAIVIVVRVMIYALQSKLICDQNKLLCS